MVSEGESQGRHLDTGVGLLANTIAGPERPTPLHLGPTKLKTSAKDIARSRSVRIGVVRFEKKFGRQPVRETAAFSRQTVR